MLHYCISVEFHYAERVNVASPLPGGFVYELLVAEGVRHAIKRIEASAYEH